MQASCLGPQHLNFERVALPMYRALELTGDFEKAGFLIESTSISLSYVLDFESSEPGGPELLVVKGTKSEQCQRPRW